VLSVCAMPVGWAVDVGLDWLPGLSGESWNRRRWPGVPTLPDDRDLLGNGSEGPAVRSFEILGPSQRCRGFVDGSMCRCTVQG